jgi:hypothetical protein
MEYGHGKGKGVETRKKRKKLMLMPMPMHMPIMGAEMTEYLLGLFLSLSSSLAPVGFECRMLIIVKSMIDRRAFISVCGVSSF